MFPWLGGMSQWQAYQLGPPLYNFSLKNIIAHARKFSALPTLRSKERTTIFALDSILRGKIATMLKIP